jgi:hypothetical protein
VFTAPSQLHTHLQAGTVPHRLHQRPCLCGGSDLWGAFREGHPGRDGGLCGEHRVVDGPCPAGQVVQVHAHATRPHTQLQSQRRSGGTQCCEHGLMCAAQSNTGCA